VNGIERTAGALADWLRAQQRRGLIALDDADEAAGMLLGMVAAAPRRPAAAVALPDRSPSAHLCGAVLAGLPNQAICLVRKLNRQRIRTTRPAWQATLDIQPCLMRSSTWERGIESAKPPHTDVAHLHELPQGMLAASG